jgi:putative hydroxymethylpyrimidine transport system substrate-binding protein
MLDWFPNVDHLPIYVAQQRGLFRAEGLDLKILSPSDTTDALKLAAAGKVDMAVSYEPQTIIAAARRLNVVAVGRLVEHPLTTLLYLKSKGFTHPRDLSGKRIGYTVPGLMDVLLSAFARINGIDAYEPVNVGFAIAQSLAADKVDAVMGPFKTYETVQMGLKGYETAFFELERWGVPDYDELIFVCGRSFLEAHAQIVSGFVNAVARAIEETRQDPERALALYLDAVPEADRRIETEAFRLTRPYYASHQRLEPKRWQTFADFALRYKLIEKPVTVSDILWTPSP